MKHRKYTIKNIKNYFKDYLNMEWIDELVYCTQKDGYRKAKLSDFGKNPVQLLIKVLKNDSKSLMLVHVTNDIFIVECGRNKIDASADWNDYMFNCATVKAAINN